MASDLTPFDIGVYRNACDQVESFLAALSDRRAADYGEAQWITEKRVKKPASISDKLARKRRHRPSYGVDDLTDVAGVRVLVDGLTAAAALASFIRTQSGFEVWSDKSEDFTEAPRADGYRAIHLVLSVKSPLQKQIIHVELQIRTMLQHQWSLLSNSEFYKAVTEIPPSLLARMKALSGILHAADIEAEQLRRNRVLDDVNRGIRMLVRRDVVEQLGVLNSAVDAREIGLNILTLFELDTQVRRVLISTGDAQMRASRSVEKLCGSLANSFPYLKVGVAELERRMKPILHPIPGSW